MTDEPVIKSAKVEETVAELPTDDSTMELNDVVLIVKGQKYNCSKTALSDNAEFFKTKFFGDKSEDKDKPEVTLEDPEAPEQFGVFLKVIKKEQCLTDENVEGVLRLSVLWQSPIVEKRCLEFLTTDSWLENCQKFDMAIKVNSEALKKRILSGIESMHDLHRMIPSDRSTWDHATTNLVFEKTLELSGWMPPDCFDKIVFPLGPLPLLRRSQYLRNERVSEVPEVPEERPAPALAGMVRAIPYPSETAREDLYPRSQWLRSLLRRVPDEEPAPALPGILYPLPRNQSDN